MKKPRKTDIELHETKSDATLRRIKDWSSVVPGIGPVMNSLFNEIIPDTRMERVAGFMKYLEARIDRIELEIATQTPEGLDLLEEGLMQAARALSDERKQYLAALVANGLKDRDSTHSEARHFARLINQLDDRQVILLCGELPEYAVIGSKVADDFFFRHEEVFNPPEQIMPGGLLYSPGEELNASLKYHLSSLGLLEIQDTIGSIGHTYNAQKYKLTPLGERLLRHIGLGNPDAED